MPVDNSIALQIQQPKLMTPFEAQQGALTIQELMQRNQLGQQQIQQNQMTMRDQADLSRLWSNQENIDPKTGTLDPTKVKPTDFSNPAMYQKLVENHTAASYKQSQAELEKQKALLDTSKEYQSQKMEVLKDAHDTYVEAINNGIPKAQAENLFQQKLRENLKEKQKSGLLPNDMQPPPTNGDLAGRNLFTAQQQQEEQDKALQRAQTAKSEQDRIGIERANLVIAQHREARETAKSTSEGDEPTRGWKMYEQGGDSYRMNENAGIVEKKVNGKWSEVDSLPEGSIRAGSTVGLKDSVRTSLVKGAAENVNRIMTSVPDLSKLRASQEVGVHPSGITGNLVQGVRRMTMSDEQKDADSTINAIVDEAIPVFTGGLRASDAYRQFIISQLPRQVGDDDKTTAKKWKLFQDNMTGQANSFRNKFSSDPKFKSPDEKGTPVESKPNKPEKNDQTPPPKEDRIPGQTVWLGHTWQADGWH